MQYNFVEDALPGGSTSYLAYAGVDRLVWDNLYVFATSLMDIAERAQSTGRLTRQDLLRMRADTEGVVLALDILEKNMPSSAIGLSTSAPQMQPRPLSALAYSSSSFASTRSTIGLGSARASTSSPLMDRRGYLHGTGRPTTMTMMPTAASNQRRNSFCTAYPPRDNTADCSFGASACSREDGRGCGSSISAAARSPPAACGRPLSLSYPMHSVPKQQHQAGDEERIPRTASDSMIDRLTSGIPRNSSQPQHEEKAKWETRRASYVGETSMTGKRSGPETVTKATMTLSRSDDGQISGLEASKRKRPKLEDKPGQVARKERRCQECKTASTSQWRQGPWGKATLCNACGLRKKRTQIGDEFGLPPAAATPMPMLPVKQEQLPTRGEKRVKCERQEEEHAAPADQAGSGSARDEKPKASIAFLLNRC